MKVFIFPSKFIQPFAIVFAILFALSSLNALVVLISCQGIGWKIYVPVKSHLRYSVLIIFMFSDLKETLEIDDETVSLVIKGLKQPLEYDLRTGIFFRVPTCHFYVVFLQSMIRMPRKNSYQNQPLECLFFIFSKFNSCVSKVRVFAFLKRDFNRTFQIDFLLSNSSSKSSPIPSSAVIADPVFHVLLECLFQIFLSFTSALSTSDT